MNRVINVVALVVALLLGVLPDVSMFVAGFVPADSKVLKYLALAILLLTRLDTIVGKATMDSVDKLLRKAPPAALVLVLLFLAPACPAGGGGNRPTDVFVDAVVDCTNINPQSSEAGAATLNCLLGLATSGYGACLAGLVTLGHWTVDEIACLVRYYGSEANQKLLAAPVGTAPDANQKKVADNAREWIKAHKIGYR